MSLSYNPPSVPTVVPGYSDRADIVLVNAGVGLPALSGGYHPMDGNFAYNFQGNTAISSPITPNGARISGSVAGKDQISSLGVAVIFGPSGSLVIENMILDGSFLSPVLALAGTGVEVVDMDSIKFLPGGQVGTISDYQLVTFRNCRFTATGKLTITNCDNTRFESCVFEGSANPVLFSGGGGDIGLDATCQFASTNTGIYIQFAADGGAYGNVLVLGTMALGASKVGIDGGETGLTPATFTSAKCGISFHTNGGTNIQNAASWVVI